MLSILTIHRVKMRCRGGVIHHVKAGKLAEGVSAQQLLTARYLGK